MNRTAFVFTFFLIIESTCFGFDDMGCREFLSNDSMGGLLTLASSQLSSSWGICSPNRTSKINQISNYIVANRQGLLNDFSRKRGEWVQTLTALCSCIEPGQNHLQNVFYPELTHALLPEKTDESLFEFVETSFRTDKTLKYGYILTEPVGSFGHLAK